VSVERLDEVGLVGFRSPQFEMPTRLMDSVMARQGVGRRIGLSTLRDKVVALQDPSHRPMPSVY
jgi:hypothetical protein